ncbi:MAG: hypothetical protein DRP90_05075 [Planctomycetota bacterium]|nr:MAG: hypothetical protein DRP90_05075 [Planctomycetota bacterium]
MRRGTFILLFAAAATGLAAAAWFASKMGERDRDEAPSPAAVTAPDVRPLELFLHARDYRERISLLPPDVRAILIEWSGEWRLKPAAAFGEILKPVWKPGSARAEVKVRVKDFPFPGEVGLATFRLRHFEEGWRLDLFASEPGYLPLLVNCLEHPVGTLLAYFGAPDAVTMKRYLFEEVLKAGDPNERTPLAVGIPWAGWRLAGIESVEVKGTQARAEVMLAGPGGKRAEARLALARLMGSWFVVKGKAFQGRGPKADRMPPKGG